MYVCVCVIYGKCTVKELRTKWPNNVCVCDALDNVNENENGNGNADKNKNQHENNDNCGCCAAVSVCACVGV